MKRFPAIPLLLLLAPLSARAECPTITPFVDTLAPATGGSGVPLNGVVAFGTSPAFASYNPVVTLTTDTNGTLGPPIAGALLSGPAGSWIFRPDDDLSPGFTYTASIADGNAFGTSTSTTFSTGGANDTIDPTILETPVLTLGEYVDPVRTDVCVQPGYWKVHVDWADAVDASPVIYALDIVITDLIPDEFAPAGIAPNVTRMAITSAVSERDINVPHESGVRVAIFAIDGAGRQGHSPDGLFETPEAPIGGGAASCGCELDPSERATGATLGAVFAIGILVLAAGLMRRVAR